MRKFSFGAKLPSLYLAVFAFCVCACQTQAPTPEFTPSGFLKDYSQLRPSSKREGALSYAKDARNMFIYKMIIMEPVQVFLHPGAKAEEINPEELDRLARQFESELREGLEDSYPIVGHAGFGVMRLRVAVTNVKTGTAFLNLNPATSIFGLGVGGATIEAEILDSQSGERLAAYVDSQPGARYKKVKGAREYGHAEELIHKWALALRDWLDEGRGLHGGGDFRSFDSYR